MSSWKASQSWIPQKRRKETEHAAVVRAVGGGGGDASTLFIGQPFSKGNVSPRLSGGHFVSRPQVFEIGQQAIIYLCVLVLYVSQLRFSAPSFPFSRIYLFTGWSSYFHTFDWFCLLSLLVHKARKRFRGYVSFIQMLYESEENSCRRVCKKDE